MDTRRKPAAARDDNDKASVTPCCGAWILPVCWPGLPDQKCPALTMGPTRMMCRLTTHRGRGIWQTNALSAQHQQLLSRLGTLLLLMPSTEEC